MKASPRDSLLDMGVRASMFKQEVHLWAERIGVEPKEVHVRPMTRKWASCSSSGRLTFDTNLLAKPRHIRDEVVVHELLHLKVPNHGKLFKSLLRAYLGTRQDGQTTLESKLSDLKEDGRLTVPEPQRRRSHSVPYEGVLPKAPNSGTHRWSDSLSATPTDVG